MKIRIEDNFGIAPNKLLNNEKISLKAKGLFVYIQSKPDGWSFSAEKIALSHRDGVASVSASLQELEENGYLKRTKMHGEGGYWTQNYELCIPNQEDLPNNQRLEAINPSFDFPLTDKPSTDNPLTENHINNSNKEISKKEIVKKNIVDDRFDKFWELYAKNIGKDKCYTEWKRINSIEKDKILNVLPSYVQSTPDIQYRKNPLKYLKEKAWLDMIVLPFDFKKKEDASPTIRPVSVISVPNDY